MENSRSLLASLGLELCLEQELQMDLPDSADSRVWTSSYERVTSSRW